jgi:hypothetical protein
MIKVGSAEMDDRLARCCLRAGVVFLALVFLAAPAGLAFHSFSHAHGDHDYGDCSLCILGSHYSAEIPFAQGGGSCLNISVLPWGDPVHPALHDFSCASVRGPPASSV